MKKVYSIFSKALLIAALPFVAGCGGGGGGLAALGSLFGLSGGGSIASLIGGGGSFESLALLGGGSTPTLVNPEPTSMILVGTGVAALAYFKRKNR